MNSLVPAIREFYYYLGFIQYVIIFMSELPVEVSGRAMILDQRGRVLILKRSENSGSNPGKWELPGGKPNKGESFEESFRREVLEETGFLITIHQSAGTADQLVSGYHVIHVVMIASIQSGGLSISDEHSEYQWAEINELGALDKADWFSRYHQVYLSGHEREEGS